MSKIRIPFTPQQKEALAANPFTLSVNDYQIRFTIEFKKYLLAEREKNGTPWKVIFQKAGYDPEILGTKRMEAIIRRIRDEAASVQGFRKTASQKTKSRDFEQKNSQKAIQELQTEVIHLQQQIEFLKKIQMLKVLEENEE